MILNIFTLTNTKGQENETDALPGTDILHKKVHASTPGRLVKVVYIYMAPDKLLFSRFFLISL